MAVTETKLYADKTKEIGLTPVMQQYVELKSANPGSLLFFRMGDFYELFFDDAKDASRALGIVLTSRGKYLGKEIPMCGVPVSRADEYLNRLIQMGHIVAVVEQLEDPEEARKRGAKAIVKRDVVRLITPGTITEDILLDAGRANYLLSIVRWNVSVNAVATYGLAWVDLSTGIFRVSEVGADRLMSELVRVDPVEIILPDYLFEDQKYQQGIIQHIKASIVPLPAKMFSSSDVKQRLIHWYGLENQQEINSLTFAEQAAVSGVLAYVERTQFDTKARLEIPKRDQYEKIMLMDAFTRSSLELVKTQSGERIGSLVNIIDRTVTSLGRRLLVERLSSPSTDLTTIQNRLDSVSRLYGDRDLCDALRDMLRDAPDILRSLSRLGLDRAGPRDLAAIRDSLDVAKRTAALLDQFSDLPNEMRMVHMACNSAPEGLYDTLKSALCSTLPQHKRDGGFIAEGYNEVLDKNRELSSDFHRHIVSLEHKYITATSIKSLKIRRNNILGFFIEVSPQQGEKLLAAQVFGNFIHRQSLVSAMRFTTEELFKLDSQINIAREQVLAQELELFGELSVKVLLEENSMRLLAEALATIDVSAGLANLACTELWCQPVVEDSLVLKIESGRHPIVEKSLKVANDNPFIANNCDISPVDDVYGRLIILTGPNMGGKSTWLRQNALIVLLAQMGSFVPAASATIGIVDRLFSRVGATDDLSRGCSTFMLEMLETSAILRQATSKSLVVFDEIGRGTSTFDGLAIAWGVVEYLIEVSQCRAIFATHYHELTILSDQLPRVENHTVKVKEWKNEVTFLREVVPGIASRSYGIHVAQFAGLPDVVIKRAQGILKMLETSRPVPLQVCAKDEDMEEVNSADDLPDGCLQVIENLESIVPDTLTPREALESLYFLKSLLNHRVAAQDNLN